MLIKIAISGTKNLASKIKNMKIDDWKKHLLKEVHEYGAKHSLARGVANYNGFYADMMRESIKTFKNAK